MKRVFFGLIFLLLLFLLTELLARAYYYRKTARSPLASYELLRTAKRSIFNSGKKTIDNTNHYTVRPNFSKAENDKVAAETREANYYIYYPWIGFSYGNIRGKYVNASDKSRKTVPEQSAPGNDPFEVWFLGGSSMFGYNLTDSETIPSAFVRTYQNHGGPPIKATNYGTPNYFSYQELIFLADNLFRGKRPDVVIMMDGLNEGAAPFASYYRNPWNTPQLQEMLNPELYDYPDGYDYYHFPDSSKIKQVSQTIYQNYLENIANAKMLADQYNFKLYCFWQPVPFYDYPNQSKDPFASRWRMYQFEYICPQVIEKAKELDYLYYFGDMLRDAKLPFIESGHYTPWMCEAIAKRMLDSIALK